MILHRAIYKRVVKDFNKNILFPVKVSTWSDAPPGSGLGTSSTLVVAILSAYVEILNLPLGDYDIANLAYEIERIDCKFAGGKQDQYAATFGGFNFIEFYDNNRVIVNPLRVRRATELELQSSLMLYYTGQSRESAKIIKDQIKSMSHNNDAQSEKSLSAMHEVKKISFETKESILKGDINKFHSLLSASWNAKKNMAKTISTNKIESIAAIALNAGAKGLKISGAGGGGFMIISIEPADKFSILEALNNEGGKFINFSFTSNGVESWKVV